MFKQNKHLQFFLFIVTYLRRQCNLFSTLLLWFFLTITYYDNYVCIHTVYNLYIISSLVSTRSNEARRREKQKWNNLSLWTLFNTPNDYCFVCTVGYIVCILARIHSYTGLAFRWKGKTTLLLFSRFFQQ